VIDQDPFSIWHQAGKSNDEWMVVHLYCVLVNAVADDSHGTGSRGIDYNRTIPRLPQPFGNDRWHLAAADVKEAASPLGKGVQLADVRRLKRKVARLVFCHAS